MSFSTEDTIVAIATPPGRGGIGVVRLAGPEALAIARQLITHRGRLEPRRATFTRVRLPGLRSAEGEADTTGLIDAIDHVVVTVLSRPFFLHRRRSGRVERARKSGGAARDRRVGAGAARAWLSQASSRCGRF
jgi:hypothetical protein